MQKYERRTNRISASRLWGIAEALKVPMSWFFEGMDGKALQTHDHPANRESIHLVRYFVACPAAAKKRIRALAKAIAEVGEAPCT